MNQNLIAILVFFGGICLAIQAAFSSHLGILLKKPVLASISTYTAGALFALTFVLFFSKDSINLQIARHVPWYLWFIGGLFSIIGITLYYFAIPKIGIGKMMTLGLSGQLIFSAIAGHYGWLSLPAEPITLKKLIGLAAMILGIFFINAK